MEIKDYLNDIFVNIQITIFNYHIIKYIDHIFHLSFIYTPRGVFYK